MKQIIFIALSACAVAATTQADIISSSPHALGGNRLYVGNLSFFDVFVELEMYMGGPPLTPPSPGSSNTSTMDGVVILNTSVPSHPPASSTHNMIGSFFDVFTELSLDGHTRSFDTEMLALNIVGTNPNIGPFHIRESPTLPSRGHYSVQTLPGGMYHIDSFFDVFTELSIDGGQTWIPSQGASRISILPTPGAGTILFPAAMLIASRRRR